MSIESRIQEQRTNEATKKNLIGMEGKIYMIAKYLGHEIIQDSEAPETIDYEGFYKDIEPNEIPYFTEDSYTNYLGYTYNALNTGHNIEILTFDYEQRIKLFYNGNCVYHEEGSVLLSFIPDEKWEIPLKALYEAVEYKVKNKLEKYKIEEKNIIAKMEEKELEKIRKKWGDII